MYKGAFRSQNRRVQVIDFHPTKAAVMLDGDARCALPDVTHLTEMEATAERSRLMLEKAGLENEIQAAKNAGRFFNGCTLGNRHQGLQTRIAALNGYLKSIRARRSENDAGAALKQAINEIVPDEETRRAIFIRARAIHQQSIPEAAA